MIAGEKGAGEYSTRAKRYMGFCPIESYQLVRC